MSTDNRAEFESAYSREYPMAVSLKPLTKFTRDESGDYEDTTVQVAWRLWNASRSIAAGAAAATEPLYANSMGYALAMRVMQSNLYPSLDPEERAECDEFIRRGLSRTSLLVEEGQAQHQAGSAHLAAPSGHVPSAAPLSSPLQSDRSELPRGTL